MIFESVPARIERLRRARFVAATLIGLVVSHDAVFVAQYGVADPAAATGTGHAYWLTFALLALLGAGVPLGLTAMGLHRIARALRGMPEPPAAGGGLAPSYAREAVALAPRLFAAVTAAFVIQENVEHLATGRGLPGLWVLSWPEYPMAIPVLLTVAILLALAAAWFRWALLAPLVARARAAWPPRRRLLPSRPSQRWLVGPVQPLRGRLMARRLAGRAPPRLVAV